MTLLAFCQSAWSACSAVTFLELFLEPRRPAMTTFATGVGGIAIAATLATASAATLEHEPYGTTQDGRAVDIYTMTNAHGLRVRFLSYGGVITEIHTPDRAGRLDNIVLGLRNLHDYETI